MRLFSSLRLRFRLRHYRGLIRSKTREIEELKVKQEQLIRTHNRELAIERRRYQLMMNSWADRLAQKHNLPSVSIAQIGVEQEFEDHKPEELSLSPSQLEYFNGVKEQFWEDGRELGKSEPEINEFWKINRAKVLDECINGVQ